MNKTVVMVKMKKIFKSYNWSQFVLIHKMRCYHAISYILPFI